MEIFIILYLVISDRTFEYLLKKKINKKDRKTVDGENLLKQQLISPFLLKLENLWDKKLFQL